MSNDGWSASPSGKKEEGRGKKIRFLADEHTMNMKGVEEGCYFQSIFRVCSGSCHFFFSSCRYRHRDAVCVHSGVPLLQRDHCVDLLLPGELLPEPPALVM